MGRKHRNRQKRLRKQRLRKRSHTKIEERIAQLLDTMGLGYYQNKRVNQYNVDFLIGDRYVVECYGDFWHCNPRKYDPDYFNRGLKCEAREKWKRDRNRKRELEKDGYSVLVLWESEINSCIPCCKRKIKNMLNGDLELLLEANLK